MAKVGRPRKIDTPQQLIEMFQAYKTYVKENPRHKYVMNQRTGDMVAEPLECPLSIEGFQVYCYNKFECTVEHYLHNTNKSYDEYCVISAHIKREIRQDQISGGMVGQYNASLTARINGLTERVESTIISEQPLFPDVPTNNSDK